MGAVFQRHGKSDFPGNMSSRENWANDEIQMFPLTSTLAKGTGPYVAGMFVQYRDEIYSLQILFSRTQAGPGRAVKLSGSRKKFHTTTYKE